MTETEARLNEERRRARDVVLAAERFLEMPETPSSKPSLWQLRSACKAYREAEYRAQREATG